MSDVLDNGLVFFYLKFPLDANKTQIAEPIGFDGANFVLKQEEKRYGRDVSFANGEVELHFSPKVEINGITHQFEKLIYYYKWLGFETKIQFILNINGIDEVIGDLDFYGAKTDFITYFTCKVIQDNKQVILKRNFDTIFNVSNTKRIYDNSDIPALNPEKILVKPPKINVESTWKTDGYSLLAYSTYSQVLCSVFPNIINNQIDITNSPPIGLIYTNAPDAPDTYLIDAKNNLTNVKIEFKNINYSFTNSWQSGSIRVYYLVSDTYDNNTINWVQVSVLNMVEQDFNLTIDIGDVERGKKVWCGIFGTTGGSYGIFDIYGGEVTVTGTSTSYASVVNAYRFSEVLRYAVDTATGGQLLGVSNDFFSGDLKNQYITSGTLMRLIDDVSLKTSLKEIVEYIQEINYDYQIMDNFVIFEHYKEFYKDIEVARFDNLPNDNFQVSFNKKYAIKNFNYRYNKYEDSNNERQSREGIHTEIQLNIFNTNVENKKEVNIPYTRDAFLIEKTRKDYLKKEKDVATSDDETLFMLDVIDGNPTFTESFYLKHTKIDDTNLLLTNDNSFRFDVLGMSGLSSVTLNGQNAGVYDILSIGHSELKLQKTDAGNVVFNGFELTKITYTVTDTNKVIRTSEGFQFYDGVTSAIANMMFSLKRNIINYWGEYLKTCVQFSSIKDIQVSNYVHNKEFKSKLYNKPLIIEGEDISVNLLPNQILTPFIVNTDVFCTFNTYKDLKNAIIQQKGYVTIITPENEEYKLYPIELDYKWKENMLSIKGELKW